jgi:hypothetical protein
LLQFFSLLLYAAEADSLERLDVAWAGFSLKGRHVDLKTLYPITRQFEKRINQTLYEQLRKVSPTRYRLVTDEKLDIRMGQTLALTLIVENESVVVRELAGLRQAVVDISASLVVFDFDSDERAIIAAFPIDLEPYIETFTMPPEEADLIKLVEGYYFGGLSNMDTGLIDTAVAAVRVVDIKQKYAAEVGIGDISLSPMAKQIMQAPFSGNEKAMKHYVARHFSRYLSMHQKVSVIPYVTDKSVAQLSLRFTGQDITVLLDLPEPDYLFNIHIEKYASKEVDKNAHSRLFLYASRAKLSFTDVYADDAPLFERSIKDYVKKEVLNSQPKINEWAVYEGALFTLYKSFLTQLDSPDKVWLKMQGSDSGTRKEIKEELKQVALVLEKCR